MATPDLVHEAETLVRSLAGVVHARIVAGPAGIDAIDVIAENDDVARSLAGHVRSALLAGLATPVLPGRIQVRVSGETAAANGARSADSGLATPRHRLRLLQDEAPTHPDAGSSHRDPAHGSMEDADAHAHEGHPAPAPHARDARPMSAAAALVVDADSPARAAIARARLVAVDIDRPGDGRVLCRVSIAYGTRVHRADAIAVDLPGAAAQAAAQAAVRALVDAGLDGLELNGLREVEIAGREYVLVALRRANVYTRIRSGSAPIVGSPERSAAEAAVHAANEMI
jgi:hypothetical protein